MIETLFWIAVLVWAIICYWEGSRIDSVVYSIGAFSSVMVLLAIEAMII